MADYAPRLDQRESLTRREQRVIKRGLIIEHRGGLFLLLIFLLLTKSLGHTPRGTQIGAPEKILDNWLKCVIIKL